jgi:alpha-L-fucosidase 2
MTTTNLDSPVEAEEYERRSTANLRPTKSTFAPLLVRHHGPSPAAAQSLPIGNGREGANVWVTETGAIHLLLAHNEAYSENSRLSKVGLVVIEAEHPALRTGEFSQELDAHRGILTLTAETGPRMRISIFADAHHPCLRVIIDGPEPVRLQTRVELCRPKRRIVPVRGQRAWDFEESGSFMFIPPENGGYRVEPDEFVPSSADTICWCHRNPYSALHRAAGSEPGSFEEDPLHGRAFGGIVFGSGWTSGQKDHQLVNEGGSGLQELTILLYCAQTETLAEWKEAMDKQTIALPSAVEALPAHCAYWEEFSSRSYITMTGTSTTRQVSQAYGLQRYLSACAGRSQWPVRFNGSMFNVAWRLEHPNGKVEDYDADYRRWNCGFFCQNTRLIYWPMLAAGDFEFMRPYFDLFLENLPIARHRAGLALGRTDHNGAFFWEALNIWDNTELRLNPKHKTPMLYVTSSLEMLMLGFDYLDFTDDPEFLEKYLFPLAHVVIEFFHELGSFDEHGVYHLIAHSTETYHLAHDPTPDMAGLRAVLPRMLEKLSVLASAELITKWHRLLAALPPFTLRDAREKLPMLPDQEALYAGIGYDVRARVSDLPEEILAPAALCPTPAWNLEIPELYPVFPFRIFGSDRPQLSLARKTFQYRRFQHDQGWAQDPIMAACLGLTVEAQRLVSGRYTRVAEGTIFPAFWEAGFDWVPDQDNGGVANIALQFMLLQWDGRTIHLLPAWPKEWDVHFKLHAPFDTTVECVVTDGKLSFLRVTPPERTDDVRLNPEFEMPVEPSDRSLELVSSSPC